jgi:hypothetical protein
MVVKWSEVPIKTDVLNLWSNNIRNQVRYFLPIVLLFLSALLLTVIGLLCIVFLPCMYLCYLMCIVLLCVYCLCNLVADCLLSPEGPATGHIGTGFSWFPCACKRMLRWFPRLQVATTCFSYSPPDLNFLDPYFIFMYMHYNHCHRETAHLQLNLLLLLL